MGVLALMLAGCGGSPVPSRDQDMYALSQANVGCTADPGTVCADVKLYATPINGFGTEFRPGWTENPADGKTRVVDHLYRDLQSDGRWQLSLGFVGGLKPGIYSGTVDVGTDLVTDVLVPIPKGHRPVALSYRLEVSSDPATRPALRAVVGAGDWAGPGGVAARTGLVAVTADPSKIKRRWSRFLQGLPTDNAASLLSWVPSPLLSNGQVVLPGMRPSDNQTATVTALQEDDGAVVWSAALPGLPDRALAVGDRLLVSGRTAETVNTTTLTSVGRRDGAAAGQVVVDGNLPNDGWTVAGDTLFLADGGQTKVTARALADLSTLRWSASLYNLLPGYGPLAQWGMTVSNGQVYASAAGRLRGFSAADGTRGTDIAVSGRDPRLLLGVALNQAPVVADATTLVLLSEREQKAGVERDNQLSVVDLATGAVRWTVSGKFMDQPVAANGVVYVSNQQSRAVEARSLINGAVVWSWAMETGDQSFQRQMVLTNSHLFVSTDRQVVALDLVSHQPVWRYGAGGLLGMTANGTLTLLNDRGGSPRQLLLVAFDVR